jgi:hypothetical protein
MPPKGKDMKKVSDEPSGSKPLTKGKFGTSPDEKICKGTLVQEL